MSKTKNSTSNYAFAGQPMTEEQFKKMVESAENGKFHSMKDLKEKISEWKQKLKK